MTAGARRRGHGVVPALAAAALALLAGAPAGVHGAAFTAGNLVVVRV
jgi:hypothetical protein